MRYLGEKVFIEKTQEIYKGFLNFKKASLRYLKFNSKWSELVEREVILRNDCVVVLLYDPTLDKVVLVKQFRCGMANTNVIPWRLEVVAGVVEKDELPSNVAMRETLEETGLDIEHLSLISSFYSMPAITNEKVYMYLGIVDSTKVENDSIKGLESEQEDIQIKILSARDAFLLSLKDGELNNSTCIIALQWLEMNFNRIQMKFCNKNN